MGFMRRFDAGYAGAKKREAGEIGTPVVFMPRNSVAHDTVPNFMERFAGAYTTQLRNHRRERARGPQGPLSAPRPLERRLHRSPSAWHFLVEMGHDNPLRIPEPLRHDVDEIFKLTDPFCSEHLDAEYGELVRKLIAKLARKRPSPLARGDLRLWAAAGIYAVTRWPG